MAEHLVETTLRTALWRQFGAAIDMLENAVLACPDTGAALGEAILDVLRDDQLRERIARNGQRYVREHHDRRLVARQVCAAYLRTLEAAGRGHVLGQRPSVSPVSSVAMLPEASGAASAGHSGRHRRLPSGGPAAPLARA